MNWMKEKYQYKILKFFFASHSYTFVYKIPRFIRSMDCLKNNFDYKHKCQKEKMLILWPPNEALKTQS